MPQDVFLSYAHEDQAFAQLVHDTLASDTVEVWLDRSLRSGDSFQDKINAALQGCKAAVCVWSQASVRSEWVRSEALFAFERRIILPVRKEPCAIPVPFNGIHAVDLSDWDGEVDHPEWRSLLARLSELLGRRALHEWAMRSRPPSLKELVQIFQRYGGDPLAQRALDIGRANFNIDISNQPLHDLPGSQLAPPPSRDIPSHTSYEHKRRLLAEREAGERSLAIIDLRGAVEAAHRARSLRNDFRVLFPTWQVELRFHPQGFERDQQKLLDLAPPHPSEQQLEAAFDALASRDSGGRQCYPDFEEIASVLDEPTIILQCDGFHAEIVSRGSDNLSCRLGDSDWEEIVQFSPPSFDEFVTSNGGAADMFSAISLAHRWIRERFVESCAVMGIRPESREAIEGEQTSRETPPHPNDHETRENRAAAVRYFAAYALLALVFAVSLVVVAGIASR